MIYHIMPARNLSECMSIGWTFLLWPFSQITFFHKDFCFELRYLRLGHL